MCVYSCVWVWTRPIFVVWLCPPETDALPHVQPVRQHERNPSIPATTYSVQRMPHRAGVAVVWPTQPSPPYGHLRPGPWLHPDRDVRDIICIGLRSWVEKSTNCSYHTTAAKYYCDPSVRMHDREALDFNHVGLVRNIIPLPRFLLWLMYLGHKNVLWMTDRRWKEVVSPNASTVHLSEKHNTSGEGIVCLSLCLSDEILSFAEGTVLNDLTFPFWCAHFSAQQVVVWVSEFDLFHLWE